MEHPENYVVKPQREGGGNNFYGDDVRRVLKVSMTCRMSIMHVVLILPTATQTNHACHPSLLVGVFRQQTVGLHPDATYFPKGC